jgi:hypothetical protein
MDAKTVVVITDVTARAVGAAAKPGAVAVAVLDAALSAPAELSAVT